MGNHKPLVSKKHENHTIYRPSGAPKPQKSKNHKRKSTTTKKKNFANRNFLLTAQNGRKTSCIGTKTRVKNEAEYEIVANSRMATLILSL